MPCIRSTYQTKRKTYTLIFSCQPHWHATKSVYYPPTFSGAFITSQTLDLPSSQSANKLETLLQNSSSSIGTRPGKRPACTIDHRSLYSAAPPGLLLVLDGNNFVTFLSDRQTFSLCLH